MTRYLFLIATLAACGGGPEKADTAAAALPAIDTLKPGAASDTAAAADSLERQSQSQTPTETRTQTRLGRDSAFPPPRNLPKLDTVPTKRPPTS